MEEFSGPAPPQTPILPADLASELAQYDATEPVSTLSAATADTSHVAPGTTNADAFLSFLEADIPKDTIEAALPDFDGGVGIVSCNNPAG